MGQLSIRNALLNQAIATLDPLVGDKLAYQNNGFDPKGLAAWASFHFKPATSESCGKTKASSDDERGFIQISIYVKANALDYDNQQLEIADEIKKDFYFGVTIGEVDILEVTLNDGFTVDSWFQRDITINYTSYQSRG
jgi:hypothetical protein